MSDQLGMPAMLSRGSLLSENWACTPLLRFVERPDGFGHRKLILQQMWRCIDSGAMRWDDVPLAQE